MHAGTPLKIANETEHASNDQATPAQEKKPALIETNVSSSPDSKDFKEQKKNTQKKTVSVPWKSSMNLEPCLPLTVLPFFLHHAPFLSFLSPLYLPSISFLQQKKRTRTKGIKYIDEEESELATDSQLIPDGKGLPRWRMELKSSADISALKSAVSGL